MEPASIKKQLITGLAAWLVFSVAAVAVRGVRWDETYEWAQILLGHVAYPDAHPHKLYAHGVYTVQHLVTAGLLALTSSELFVNGFRNVLFLFAGVAPVFALTLLLTRWPLIAHATVVLVLRNVLVPFETTYPMRIWPHCFSNGPIGSGWVLLTVFCVVAGYWRTGALMLGLMPAIHLGQMPVALVTCALYGAVLWRRGERASLYRAGRYLGAGLAASAVLFVVVKWLALAPAAEGPYASTADAMTIWRNYKEVWYHTSIRQGLTGFLYSDIALGLSLLIGSAAAWMKFRDDGPRSPWLWLFVFCGATAATVWSIMVMHNVFGERIPFLFIAWLPYRLANLVPPVLLAMLMGILCWPGADSGAAPWKVLWLVAVAAGVSVVAPVLTRLGATALYERYLASGEWIVFAGSGLALASLAARLRGYERAWTAWCLIGAAALGLLLVVHQFAFACVLLGGAIHVGAQAIERRSEVWSARLSRTAVPVAAVLALTALAASLVSEYRARGVAPEDGFDVPLARSSFDEGVRQLLAERGEPQALLVADNFAAFLQARTGHPVMLHWMSGSYSIYNPAFAPVLQKIFRDVYGIAYGESLDGGIPQQPEVWQALWARRVRSDWQALGETYAFNYIIAPNSITLDLEPIFERDGSVLYEIAR